MFDLINQGSVALRPLLGSPWLWVVVFLVAGLDALLPFMPSEAMVIAVAVLLGPDLEAQTMLLVVAALGAFAGDCLGHAIGRTAGPHALALLQRGEKGRSRSEWARERLERSAVVLIVTGRFVPGGRVASALATGSLHYPFARFALLDVIGVVIWSIYSVLVGYLGARQFTHDPAKGLLLSFTVGLLGAGLIIAGRRLFARR